METGRRDPTGPQLDLCLGLFFGDASGLDAVGVSALSAIAGCFSTKRGFSFHQTGVVWNYQLPLSNPGISYPSRAAVFP